MVDLGQDQTARPESRPSTVALPPVPATTATAPRLPVELQLQILLHLIPSHTDFYPYSREPEDLNWDTDSDSGTSLSLDDPDPSSPRRPQYHHPIPTALLVHRALTRHLLAALYAAHNNVFHFAQPECLVLFARHVPPWALRLVRRVSLTVAQVYRHETLRSLSLHNLKHFTDDPALLPLTAASLDLAQVPRVFRGLREFRILDVGPLGSKSVRVGIPGLGWKTARVEPPVSYEEAQCRWERDLIEAVAEIVGVRLDGGDDDDDDEEIGEIGHGAVCASPEYCCDMRTICAKEDVGQSSLRGGKVRAALNLWSEVRIIRSERVSKDDFMRLNKKILEFEVDLHKVSRISRQLERDVIQQFRDGSIRLDD